MFDTQDCLEKLVPVKTFSRESKTLIASRAEFLHLKKGDCLFREGGSDNNSFFLIEGSIELRSDGKSFKVRADTENANYPLAQFQPRQYSAYALNDAIVLNLDRELIEQISMQQGSMVGNKEQGLVVNDVVEELNTDWMTRILQSDLFSKLPASNIQKIFARIEPIQVVSGETIIHQDEQGDYFYILEAGRAEVSRQPSRHARAVKLNDLIEGDYFGEEALVSNCLRNANVTMLTNGEIMRLSKADFIELIRKPVLKEMEPHELILDDISKYIWIDVRFPDECHENTGFDKMNIPLNLIRMQIQRLDPDKQYMICCEDGKKSAVAAFLLAQKGYQAAYVKGGLINCRHQIKAGLNLDFLASETTSQYSTVIEFIPRKEPVDNELKSDSAENNDRSSNSNETDREDRVESETESEVSSQTTHSEIEEDPEQAVETEAFVEETFTPEGEETEVSAQAADSNVANTSDSHAQIDSTELNNTDAIKKLMDHYRLEQERTLAEIRSRAEVRINNELERIKALYREKEDEVNNLKKLKQAVSERIKSNMPVLTDEVEKQSPIKENKIIEPETENKSSVTDNSKREILNKRYAILNDSRFREHIRQLNIEKDREFKEAIDECKSIVGEEEIAQQLDINTLKEENNLPAQKIEDDSRQPEDKSDRTIEEDIRGWINEQEAFENDPDRVELMTKRKQLMIEIEERALRNKRLGKIHDRSLIREINSALKKKTEE